MDAPTQTQLADEVGGRLETIVTELTGLSSINSGSYNPEGVTRTAERLGEWINALEPDDVRLESIDPSPVMTDDGTIEERPVGSALVASKNADAPTQVLLFGHVDTVFPADHDFQTVTRKDDKLSGPGVTDCIGGMLIGIEALRLADHHGVLDAGLGWTFVAVPDEEIGSTGSKPVLAGHGQGCIAGLGFEPSLPDGSLSHARKGSVTVHAVVSGRPAHVGREHALGRSAIRGLAEFITTVEAFTNESITVNCGRVTGGGPLNVVPDRAVGSFNIRVLDEEAEATVRDQFIAAAGAFTETPVELVWTGHRPAKTPGPGQHRLLELGADLLGNPVPVTDTGGCCDGNDLAAAGLPNLDTLGILGSGIHSSDEVADLSSIPTRAAFAAGLLAGLAGASSVT